MATDLKTLQEAILYFSDEMNCMNRRFVLTIESV